MNSGFPIYLLAPILGWVTAQCIKVILRSFKLRRRPGYTAFFQSGSMPSSHSATTVALLTVIGVHEGIDSALFAIMAVVTGIVVYDAVNVRRAVGEQGRAIEKLLEWVQKDISFYTAKGHVLTEVIAGGILGFFVGLGLLQIL